MDFIDKILYNIHIFICKLEYYDLSCFFDRVLNKIRYMEIIILPKIIMKSFYFKYTSNVFLG